MITKGNYITIQSLDNKYLDNILVYVLEHFDKREHSDSVIIIGSTIYNNIDYFRKKFPGKKIIVYNWEQIVDNNTYFDIPIYIENIRGADEIWDYDELNTVYLGWLDIKVDKILPFKYTKNLKRIKNKIDPEIDVLVYGYMNDVRLNKLKDIYPSLYHNYSIVTTSGLSKEVQDEYIANSKIILNLHGIEPYSRQEQERIGFLLINEKCVLSEANQLNYFGDLIVDTPLNNISNKIKELLLKDKWKDVARNGHRFYRDELYSTYKKVEI